MRRGLLFDISKQDILGVVEKYISPAIKEDSSAKVIFGKNSKLLEMYVKNGSIMN